MKTKKNLWVILGMVAGILSSCSDVQDYEYVETVKIETILSHNSSGGCASSFIFVNNTPIFMNTELPGDNFNVLVYMKNNEVKTVELASTEDKAFRLKEFHPGDEVLLYKRDGNYYIASEKITSENVNRENREDIVFRLLMMALIIALFAPIIAVCRPSYH
ncbi:MAG: hypothetical protein J6A33_03960 [Alphaproteobacteria bacterium]|nr:hypothetical protein [Alphaproteobacteria bacterium]